MLIVMTAAKCNKLHRSGMNKGFGAYNPSPCSTATMTLSLLQELFDRGSA